LLQITQIDLEPIENASRLMCGDHHHVDKLEECFPAKVSKRRNDLTEMVPGGSSIRETSWFHSAVSGKPFSSDATAASAQAMKKHSILRGVLFFTPCPCKVSHGASVNDRCALNA
jgi:hypothetical protein